MLFAAKRQKCMYSNNESNSAFTHCWDLRSHLHRHVQLCSCHLTSAVCLQLRKLEGVLYAMPEVPGAVPAAFTQVEPVEEEGNALLQHQNKLQGSCICVDLS